MQIRIVCRLHHAKLQSYIFVRKYFTNFHHAISQPASPQVVGLWRTSLLRNGLISQFQSTARHNPATTPLQHMDRCFSHSPRENGLLSIFYVAVVPWTGFSRFMENRNMADRFLPSSGFCVPRWNVHELPQEYLSCVLDPQPNVGPPYLLNRECEANINGVCHRLKVSRQALVQAAVSRQRKGRDDFHSITPSAAASDLNQSLAIRAFLGFPLIVVIEDRILKLAYFIAVDLTMLNKYTESIF